MLVDSFGFESRRSVLRASPRTSQPGSPADCAQRSTGSRESWSAGSEIAEAAEDRAPKTPGEQPARPAEDGKKQGSCPARTALRRAKRIPIPATRGTQGGE